MAHNVRSTYVVVWCKDPRIQKAVRLLLDELGIKEGDFDPIVFAGGAAGNRTHLYSELDSSVNLHETKVAILTIHKDCAREPEERVRLFLLINAAKYARDQLGMKVRLFEIFLDDSFNELHPSY